MESTDRILKALKNGSEPDTELSGFFSEMSSEIYKYAVTSFTFNYYNYNEKKADGNGTSDEELKIMYLSLHDIVKQAFLSPFDPVSREKAISKLDYLRFKTKVRTRILTAYSDQIHLYRYMFSRLEDFSTDRDFDKADYTNEIFIGEETRKIYGYIFKDNDNAAINDRIREVLSELPVRMTKDHFFDLLKNNLDLYKGADVSSLNGNIFRLRSACGLLAYENPEKSVFPNIGILVAGIEKKASLDTFRQGNLSVSEIEEYEEELKMADNSINRLIDEYTSFVEQVNFMYAAVLNQAYADSDALKMSETLKPVVNIININAMDEKSISVADMAEGIFKLTEGCIEDSCNRINRLEGVYAQVCTAYPAIIDAMQLKSQCDCLYASDKLISDSLFAPLKEEEAAETDMFSDETLLDENGKIKKNVDDEMLSRVFDGLKKLFTTAFAQSKLLGRARMAAALSNFNVFFTGKQEIADYIREALSSCHDRNEFCASIQLENELIGRN